MSNFKKILLSTHPLGILSFILSFILSLFSLLFLKLLSSIFLRRVTSTPSNNHFFGLTFPQSQSFFLHIFMIQSSFLQTLVNLPYFVQITHFNVPSNFLHHSHFTHTHFSFYEKNILHTQPIAPHISNELR